MVTKDLLAQLYDAIPVSIALVSSDSEVIYTNVNWQHAFDKYQQEQIFSREGQSWPPDEMPQQQLQRELSAALNKAQLQGVTSSSIRANMRVLKYLHHLTFFIAPFTVHDQTFTLVSAHIHIDFTSGDLEPAFLVGDEGKILDSLLEGVVIQDSQGIITANNPASEVILGLNSEQMRGLANADPKWATITEDGQPCPPEEHPSAVAMRTGHAVLDFTMGIKIPNGQIRWLKINSQPIFSQKEKKPHMTVTSFVDITDERDRQEHLAQLSSKLQLAMDVAKMGVWEYCVKTQKLIWDDAMFHIFDVSPQHFKGTLTDFTRTLYPPDSEEIIGEFKHAISHGLGLNSEFRIVTGNGNIRNISVAATHIKGLKGKSDVYFGINRDVTNEKRAQDKIQQSRDRLLDFISSMPVAVFSVDGESIRLNKRAELIIGYENDEIKSVQSFFDLLFPHDLHPEQSFYESVTSNTEFLTRATMRIMRRDREIRWMEFSGCTLEDGQAWVIADITEKRAAEEELKKLAYYDTLTHLHNRTAIENRLIQSVNRSKVRGKMLGLLVIDLDAFKNINDTYGHPAGDQLLVLVAERLKNRVRRSDTIGRMGGDEFMVIVENVTHQDQLLTIANEFIACFKDPIHLDRELNVLLQVSISVGASLFPEHGKDYVHLFRNADTALYKAKSLGKGRAQLYSEAFTQDLKTRLMLEQRIETALEQQAFDVYFQPIVNCQTNKIVSVECLTRWHDPKLGNVSPETFIPTAESSGQIIRLGLWVLKQACLEFVAWQKNNIDLNYVAVNVSPTQLKDTSFSDSVKQILYDTQLPPDKLVLEITEGVLVEDQAATKNNLIELKKVGVKLAIDDFGTGYSSLAYLKYFDVDILKIDRSFIADIAIDPVDTQITGAIISMAKNLNLRVVAEGVETKEQLTFIQQHACDTYQGFLKSPAVLGAQIVTLIEQDFE